MKCDGSYPTPADPVNVTFHLHSHGLSTTVAGVQLVHVALIIAGAAFLGGFHTCTLNDTSICRALALHVL